MERLDPRQRRLKKEFIEIRGYWPSQLDDLLRLDPDFLEAYMHFSGVPWKNGVLEPKVKELIYIAVDASPTHSFESGLRGHIRNALRYGATKEEIMEVLEIVSAVGMHACAIGVPILLEEVSLGKGEGQKRSRKDQ